ncbi:hypothetical protein TD95_003789 [Thielaviopsis punctulata]|uniref:Major facilitator superfamily (MFS) profile domain-containing protein n=1 Tax=Thielaviopsis punctulata TaxID=72032 RepID=A0A0F4ZET1_9PEZI|nr:hypothetical protein TD95_003789 [Thielaviopsis punctulata]
MPLETDSDARSATVMAGVDDPSTKPSTTPDVDASAAAANFKPSRDFKLAFSALLGLAMTVALDATTLAVALPTMSKKIGGTALQAFWSGTSFLLASTVVQPTIAALSSVFGRKNLVYCAIVLFFAGSLIAALANDFNTVIVGRTIQGIGGGGLLSLTEVVVTDLVPLAVRGHYFSYLSAIWALGTVIGPMVGAGFAENVTWRWIFYINLPMIGVASVLVYFFLNQSSVPGTFSSKVRRIDWVGTFIFTTGSTSFLFGLSTGGVMYPWSSWRCLLPLIIGFILMAVFLYWEFNYAAEPLVSRGLFNNWSIIVAYIHAILHGALLWSILYFLLLYYQGVKFYNPVVSSLAALPETLTVAPAAGLVGALVAKTGRYRWAIWAGWALATLGSGLLLLLGPKTKIVQWIFLNLPVGVGTGMLFPATALAIQAACEPELNDQAAAFFSFLRTFGQSIGVATSGVIFQNAFKHKLQNLPAFASQAHELSGEATLVVEVIKAMANSPAKTQLVQAYSDAMHAIYYELLAFSAVSLALSITMKAYSLDQEHVSSQKLVEKARESDAEKA